MFVSTESFSLDEYAIKKKLTQLDINLLKTFFDLDIETRQYIVENLRDVFKKLGDTTQPKPPLTMLEPKITEAPSADEITKEF